ncbi:MAG: acetate kinase [Desulfovibrionaceae bacterium]
MNIFVINSGSSSFKYQLIDMDKKKALCSGAVECIGDPNSFLTHKQYPDTDKEKKYREEGSFINHEVAMKRVIELLSDKEHGVIESVQEVDAVGHRVVQGGEKLKETTLMDEHSLKIVKEIMMLAPLHNPVQIIGIEITKRLLPHAPSVAVFDTAFHTTIPEYAYMYPLPYSLYEKHAIRKYGFHGTSHMYVSREGARFLGRKLEATKSIVCHLGNGSSVAAVKNGKSIDTSMGFTPLDGLMMGTRCGSIDPAISSFLVEQCDISEKEVNVLYNKESGFKGICGMSDLREVMAAVESGDTRAKLASDMFAYRVKLFIGGYMAALNGIDALLFTAGIGENCHELRESICADLDHLGIILDLEKNGIRSSEIRCISTKESKIPVLVVPTNEELEIAEQSMALIAKQ